jgi:valyl-tRNA synthetase
MSRVASRVTWWRACIAIISGDDELRRGAVQARVAFLTASRPRGVGAMARSLSLGTGEEATVSRWFVTVSIPYVNVPPHVGYALELVQADVLSRSRRQLGDEVRFLAPGVARLWRESAARGGTDALRWWLCREVTPAADADFSIQRLVARADEDLANGLGNLAARVGTMIARYLPGGVTPRLDAPNVGSSGTELAQALAGLQTGVQRHIERYDLRSATGLVSGVVSQVNRYIDTTRPWELARRQPRTAVRGEANSAAPPAPPAPSAPGRAELKDVLGLLAGALAELARAVEPILPEGAARLGHRTGPAFPRIGARR